MALHYWQVVLRIRTEIAESRHAAYGAAIVSTLSRQDLQTVPGSFSRLGLANGS
jgi:hypothetical protein